jgi:hypothetical protein
MPTTGINYYLSRRMLGPHADLPDDIVRLYDLVHQSMLRALDTPSKRFIATLTGIQNFSGSA